jgi:hypothetical protein
VELLRYTLTDKFQNNSSGFEMNKYTEEGMKCFHTCKGEYMNPYNLGSHQYNNFERGWTQALKRSSNQLLNVFGKGRERYDIS